MPMIGDIRLFPSRDPPQGWLRCDGSQLPIQQFQALFHLIGTTYGGNGTTNFALPDLRSRTPVGQWADTFKEGSKGGSESHVLTLEQMPAHRHGLLARATPATAFPPKNGWMATTPADKPLFRRIPNSEIADLGALHEKSISEAGDNQAHDNMQPFLVLSFCIAITGYLPPQPKASQTGAAE